MEFLPSVVRAKYDGRFRIHLTFNDSLQGSVDLESRLEGPIFEPLKDLASRVAEMKQQGMRFRNEIVVGPGGKQILLEDPDGNPVELFEAAT